MLSLHPFLNPYYSLLNTDILAGNCLMLSAPFRNFIQLLLLSPASNGASAASDITSMVLVIFLLC